VVATVLRADLAKDLRQFQPAGAHGDASKMSRWRRLGDGLDLGQKIGQLIEGAGVGKSAVATLLAHHLAYSGRRVLAIDFDHQGNFTKPLRMSGSFASAAFSSDGLMTGVAPALPDQPSVLVPADRALLGLERQPALHTPFARNFRNFLSAVNDAFDVCVVDTNPNPDIRVIAALASADFVLSPIQLNQEAMDGVSGLLNHERIGLRKIKAILNPKLSLIGLPQQLCWLMPRSSFRPEWPVWQDCPVTERFRHRNQPVRGGPPLAANHRWVRRSAPSSVCMSSSRASIASSWFRLHRSRPDACVCVR